MVYSSVFLMLNLEKIRQTVASAKGKGVVGVTCGAFDLCHYGHILVFQECKEVCDHLIVALQSDPSLDRAYKNKPVQTITEREGLLRAIKYIDDIVLYDTEADLYKLLQLLSPDIRIIGADWYQKKYTGWDLPIKMHFNKRDHSYSTSELRKRIHAAEQEKMTS
ncbi:MAG: glycerol-3-phosphate cytidylyltransferase [Parcubacteria group bacterium Greene0416_14]|nr:MAG: glycerol-3-phosphate cytidylyltransferase [Parcubacteria group bacterium Greene0416_14]TSD07321.1 MAG: glycerol-3-phosphate cytidylyltransferase [Parcubacteria group bacterium Greene0714_4]